MKNELVLHYLPITKFYSADKVEDKHLIRDITKKVYGVFDPDYKRYSGGAFIPKAHLDRFLEVALDHYTVTILTP